MDLVEAHIQDCMGRVDDAIQIVYKDVDELLRTGKFAECDECLKSVMEWDSIPYSTEILLALLVATLPVQYTLLSRDDFRTRVEKTLRERGDYEKDILLGL